MNLFRPEAIASRSSRLSGDVAIAVPVAWQNIGYLLSGGVILVLLFLSIASYTRVETVAGTIVPDKGVTVIFPIRNGIIQSLSIADGQSVAAGAEIAAIRSEEDSANGISTAAQIEKAIIRQDDSLASQIVATNAATIAQQHQLQAQQAGISTEITQLLSQIALQQDLIASAQKDYDRAHDVAKRGFISGRDLQVREETLLARRQGLAQLEQTIATRRAALSEAERSSAQIAAQAEAQRASLSASRAQVAQQAASTAGSRSYVLRAPVSGRVTALTARIGQTANPQVPLMSIIPAGSTLRAELSVPSSAIGFVKKGQEVRLALDAFPYQRFGTVKGRILTVAGSAINRQTPNGGTISVYPVTVVLDRKYIAAFGRQEALIAGMTLTARIVTERQILLQWLFEPLFAVTRR